jgi:hypothetical protein
MTITKALAAYCGGVAFSYWVFSKPYEVADSQKDYPKVVHNYYKCKTHMVDTFSKPLLSATWPWSMVLLTSGTLIPLI